MNKPTDFTDHDLADALRSYDSAIEPSEEHVASLRSKLLSRTYPVVEVSEHTAASSKVDDVHSVQIARRQPTRIRSWLGVTVAMVAATALIALAPLWGTATSGLASALEATRHSSWIHGRTIVEQDGEVIESESWCSPLQRIAAFRTKDSRHFTDYAAGIQSSVASVGANIYKWRVDGRFENGGGAFVRALLSDGDLSTVLPTCVVSSTTKSSVVLDGQNYIQYSFQSRMKSNAEIQWDTTILCDQRSRRIVAWEERHANGLHINTRFDYPISGPKDIYDLGVDRSIPVVDRVASSDLVALSERFQRDVLNFDNYEALVIDRSWPIDADLDVASDLAETREVTLIRLMRSGVTYEVDVLRVREGELAIPDQPDLAWWSAHAQQFETCPLARCDGEAYQFYPIDESMLDTVAELSPPVRKRLSVPAIKTTQGSQQFVLPPWPQLWPEYACRPFLLSHSPEFRYEIDPAGRGGPERTMKLTAIAPDNPLNKQRAQYWLQLDTGDCLARSLVKKIGLAPGAVHPIEKDIQSDFNGYNRSPLGYYFASERTTLDSATSHRRRTSYLVKFN